MRISDWSSNVCSSDLIIRDIGKPRRSATFEVERAAQFTRSTAAQIHSFGGESLPLDVSRAGVGHIGITRRIPYGVVGRSEEHTSELQSLMRISYAVLCLKKKKTKNGHKQNISDTSKD